MRTQGEDGHLQGKKRGLRGNQPCPHFDLGLLAYRNMRDYFSVVETSQSIWFFVMAALQTNTDFGGETDFTSRCEELQ